jgi:hypothetical protein
MSGVENFSVPILYANNVATICICVSFMTQQQWFCFTCLKVTCIFQHESFVRDSRHSLFEVVRLYYADHII